MEFTQILANTTNLDLDKVKGIIFWEELNLRINTIRNKLTGKRMLW